MDHQKDWTGCSSGTLVWVSDQDEAFIAGEIKSITGGIKLIYLISLYNMSLSCVTCIC